MVEYLIMHLRGIINTVCMPDKNVKIALTCSYHIEVYEQ